VSTAAKRGDEGSAPRRPLWLSLDARKSERILGGLVCADLAQERRSGIATALRKVERMIDPSPSHAARARSWSTIQAQAVLGEVSAKDLREAVPGAEEGTHDKAARLDKGDRLLSRSREPRTLAVVDQGRSRGKRRHRRVHTLGRG